MGNEYTVCNKCKICEYTPKQCMPKGTDSPVLYFVGDGPSPDERREGIPFVGKTGQYLHVILDKLGLNTNNCRFSNIVRCYPCDDSQKFRSPNEEEVSNCKHYLFEDIETTKPKVVIALGATAAKAIINDPDLPGITKFRGQYRNVIIGGYEVIVMPTYHPSYLMRNPNPVTIGDFESDVKAAMALSLGSSPETVPTRNTAYKKNGSVTHQCRTYKEFNEFVTKYIDNVTSIGYDIETNAEEVHHINHRVVGFSLAGSPSDGCYVCMESLDYTMSPLDRRLVEKRLRNILLSHHIIVYNMMHEMPATLNWLGITIPDIEDLFVKVKLMMGNADEYKGNGGLKMQCMMYLKYEDWSEDLDEYFEILKTFKPSSEERLRKLLSKYYEDPDELDNVYKLAMYALANDIKTKGSNSYGLVPSNLISRYGSIDSSVLFEFKEYYDKWMTREGNNLGIDLFQGYEYWMEHHYAGYILERNGFCWDEEKAQEIKNWCETGMLRTTRELIFSPLSRNYLRDKLWSEFLVYLKDNYIDKILGDGLTVKRMYKTSVNVQVDPNNDKAIKSLNRMSIFPNEKGQAKLELGNIETLARGFLADHSTLYDEWYDNYMEGLKSEDHTVADYKKIMSPTSTGDDYKNFISSTLITDRIRYAKLFVELTKFVESPDFNVEELKYSYTTRRGETYTTIFPKDSVDAMCLLIVDKLRHDTVLDPTSKLDMFLKFLDKMNGSFITRKVIDIVNSSLDFKLSSLDAGVMNEIYELYLMCGIDVDNPSTWNEEFKYLFNYIYYKKFSKLLSTYINGKTGHQNVYLVDKESFERGDDLTRRETLYKDIPDGTDMSDKQYLMQAEFLVNFAESGRWKCLAGDTRIPLLDGRLVPIKYLEGYGNFYVYSYDIENKRYIPGHCLWCKCTGENVPIIKVTFEDGSSIKCTPDHKFLLTDGTYKEAQYLTSEDDIMYMGED